MMRLVLFVIGLGVALAWYVPTMTWGYKISLATQEAQAGKPGAYAKIADLAGGPAPLRWLRDKGQKNDLFNTSYLSDVRAVRLTIERPFATLLAEGEAAPAPVFTETYAAARTPGQLIAHCPELLRTIAVKCDVARPKARMEKDGRARMEGMLRFVPAEAPGTLSGDAGARMNRVSGWLTSEAKLPFDAASREAVMLEAAHVCRALRKTAGNCVVSSVSLAPRQGLGTEAGVTFLQASFTLTVHGDPERFTRNRMGKELAGISPLFRF